MTKVAGETDPYWWADAGPPSCPPERALPAEVDVLVIGAGLTGLTAARTLARAGRSVLVLDADEPGIGASSRNGGMIGGGHRLSVTALTRRFGAETAAALLREAHLESTAFARHLMETEDIDCDFAETGRFRALWLASEYDKAGAELDRIQAMIPLEAEMVPRARQHDEIASDLYAGGTLYHRHGGLNPAEWVAGISRAARRAGAIVQGATPVTALVRDAAAFRASTPRGAVRAGAVLAATNGYTPEMLPALRRRIVPVPSFIVATEPLGDNRMLSLIPKRRMIVESRERHCYYRPSPDGTRLVFGGRAALRQIGDAKARAELRRLIAQIFPDLAGVELTHSWRGRTGFTFESLPHLGQIDGVWHAMGYSGNGNAMAPWLGHKAALKILGDPAGETAFAKTGFPTRAWARGTPWFLPAADLMFRMRDRVSDIRKSL